MLLILEGRFFHGYYDHYCFLPLYVFCGQQLLVSYLRPSRIDGAKHAWAILASSGALIRLSKVSARPVELVADPSETMSASKRPGLRPANKGLAARNWINWRRASAFWVMVPIPLL